jgi:ElaB/YqjD/DUF883 family membrane-anchored ribosome-binding protein
MKKYWTEEKIKSAKYDSLLNEVEKVKKEADELMMKKIEHYEKEIALVREDAQIQILRLDKRIGELAAINAEHQKLNGELREDNKKLAKQVDDYTNQLRKAGVI